MRDVQAGDDLIDHLLGIKLTERCLAVDTDVELGPSVGELGGIVRGSVANRKLALRSDRERLRIAVAHRILDEFNGRIRVGIVSDPEITHVTPGGTVSVRRAGKVCDDAGPAREIARSRVIVDGRRSAVAETGQFVENKRRPDDHRGVAGEVKRTGLIPVKLARRRSLGDRLVELQHLGGLRYVERLRAVGADRRYAIGQEYMLEHLAHEVLVHLRCGDEAVQLRRIV